MMAGAIPGYFGYKAYTVSAGKAQFYFFLYYAESAELLALMEADTLGQKRTGAATGLATRILSSPGERDATLFGAGCQGAHRLRAMERHRQRRRAGTVNK